MRGKEGVSFCLKSQNLGGIIARCAYPESLVSLWVSYVVSDGTIVRRARRHPLSQLVGSDLVMSTRLGWRPIIFDYTNIVDIGLNRGVGSA